MFLLRHHTAPNPRVQRAKVGRRKKKKKKKKERKKERKKRNKKTGLSKCYLTYANIYARLVYISSNGNRKREGENRTGNQATC